MLFYFRRGSALCQAVCTADRHYPGATGPRRAVRTLFFARFIEYVESSPCRLPAALHIQARRAYVYYSAFFYDKARRNNFHGEHRRACAGECDERTVCRFYRRIYVARHGIAGSRISCRDNTAVCAERVGGDAYVACRRDGHSCGASAVSLDAGSTDIPVAECVTCPDGGVIIMQ